MPIQPTPLPGQNRPSCMPKEMSSLLKGTSKLGNLPLVQSGVLSHKQRQVASKSFIKADNRDMDSVITAQLRRTVMLKEDKQIRRMMLRMQNGQLRVT